MKKHLFVLATLASVSGLACAQSSLQMYGNLDTGLMSTDAPTYKLTSQFTSGWTPTFVGFRGSERLDGGLTASFRLESGINMSNGGIGQYPPAPGILYNRGASVALSGSMGTFSMGRVTNVSFLELLAIDPRGISNIGSGLQHWTIGNGNSNDINAVSYTTPNLSGVTGRIEYGYGNVAGNSKASATTRGSVDYRTKDLVLALGGFTQNNATGLLSNSGWIAGASYAMGALTLKGYAAGFNGNFQSGPGGTTSPGRVGDLRNFGFGGHYDMSKNLRVDLGYYTLKDDENRSGINTKTLASGAYYKLSPRTTLYAQVAQVKNQSLAGAQSAVLLHNGANDDQASFGAIGTTTQLNLGVRHSF